MFLFCYQAQRVSALQEKKPFNLLFIPALIVSKRLDTQYIANELITK